MFWGEKLILKDLSQLNFTASQVFKSLKYYDFQFIKSISNILLIIDGSDFDNNEGLQTFDEDRMEYLQMTMEEYISINGTKGLDL